MSFYSIPWRGEGDVSGSLFMIELGNHGGPARGLSVRVWSVLGGHKALFPWEGIRCNEFKALHLSPYWACRYVAHHMVIISPLVPFCRATTIVWSYDRPVPADGVVVLAPRGLRFCFGY